MIGEEDGLDASAATGARLPGMALALLPGALTVYLAFSSGGFFAAAPASAAILLLAVLAGRILFVARPGRGFNPMLGLSVGALVAFALWTFLSGGWSTAPSRALISFDRATLYVLVLVLFGSAGGEVWRVRWLLRGMALAAVIVCGAALITRLLPGVLHVHYQSISTRLSYPLTYWNSLGLLAALGLTFCVGQTCNEKEAPVVRVLSAAAIPLVACALLLTLSRGAIVTAVLGAVIFAVVARPRGLAGGLVAALPTTAVAVVSTYNASLIVSDRVTASGQIANDAVTPTGVAQGHHLALVVGLCVVGAALLRTILLRADRAAIGIDLSARGRRLATSAGAAVVIAGLVAAALVVNLPREYNRFLASAAAQSSVRGAAGRANLTDPNNDGRVEQWRIALDQFKAAPLRGTGAGTFELAWNHRRTQSAVVLDAPLYPEILAELGLIGLLWLLLAIAPLVLGIARRSRGPDRAVYATALATAAIWILAAGIDFHWEMSAVTMWFFALGGSAIAARRESAASADRFLAWPPRLVIAVGCCVLIVLVPVRVALSQKALETATSAFTASNCARAASSANDSISALGGRPQPYTVLASCDLLAGRTRAAIAHMGDAVNREPGNGLLEYGLAVALARNGQDPRTVARLALFLDPLELVIQKGLKSFDARTGAAAWRKEARLMEIVIPLPT